MLLVPFGTFAQTIEWKHIPTLSGILVWAPQIVEKAYAEVSTAVESFDIYEYVFSKVKREPIREKYVEHTLKMAEKYNVSAEQLAKTIVCESGYTQYGKGKWGLLEGKANELGILQYKISTFINFEEEFKREDLTIKDAFDQIELGAIAFSNNKQEHWSCWLRYYNPKLYKRYFP